MLQKDHTILRNFPVLGHFRFLFKLMLREVYQYFVESDKHGVTFDRDTRSLVYQSAKYVSDTVPFGTKERVYEVVDDWVNHSMAQVHNAPEDMRVTIGGLNCTQSYSASLLNISAMSQGALSKNAILALSTAAKQGIFSYNTGEGGVSPCNLEGGADLISQIGTRYFGCRTDDGNFSDEFFEATAKREPVKMIENKLSQGTKPGNRGILPAAKLTEEIAAIRHAPMAADVNSPPRHRLVDSPRGLLNFVQRLRRLSGGNLVGFKLCVGKRRESLAVCKAMAKTGTTPNFISFGGGEG